MDKLCQSIIVRGTREVINARQVTAASKPVVKDDEVCVARGKDETQTRTELNALIDGRCSALDLKNCTIEKVGQPMIRPDTKRMSTGGGRLRF